MSQPRQRHPYERRARIARTIALRRVRNTRRAGVVAASIAVMLISGLGVWGAVHMLGSDSGVEPLYVSTPAAAEAQLVSHTPPPQLPVIEDIDPVAAPDAVEASPTGSATFNGKQLRAVKTVRMLVTAYSPDERSCGKFSDGLTATGYSVFANGGKLVAADPRVLPMGSIISVGGYAKGQPVPVLDVGAKIKGHRLDVLFPTHKQARQWGKRWIDVTVYAFAPGS